MVTARNSLDKLVAGVSTRANLLTYFNSNLDIIDAALAKCNFAAGADPVAGDDSADGYVVGSVWFNVTGHKIFLCEDATEGAAVWRQIYPTTGLAAASISFASTARVLGRKTAGAGAGEECTITEILDLLGTAERGDILYRGASGWAFLPHGTSGQVLQSGGHGADPSWQTLAAGANWAIQVEPSGPKNGSNKSFTLPHTPTGTVSISFNGIEQKSGVDYSNTGTALTLITFAPAADDWLSATYLY